MALIKYVEINKDADNDWFKLEPNKEGTKFITILKKLIRRIKKILIIF